MPLGRRRLARLVRQKAIAKAIRATTAAPAPTAMPAFAPTERPLSGGDDAAAPAVDEADSVADALVPEVASDVVLDAEEAEDVSVVSEAVVEAW